MTLHTRTSFADRIKNTSEETADLRCFLLIFLCFFLTSAGYLSWLYHLTDFVSPETADLLTMGGGYILQAAGIGVFARLVFRNPEFISKQAFVFIILFYIICTIPALLSLSALASIVFGLLMNFFCGMIAGFYLHILTWNTKGNSRAVLFGTGYAAASIAAWLLSFPANGHFLQSPWSVLVYIGIAAVTAVIGTQCFSTQQRVSVPDRYNAGPSGSCTEDDLRTPYHSDPSHRLLLLSCCTIFLLSLVKNIGFSFSTVDILSGVSLEFSRIFYAAGLIIAGILSEKNRKYGAFCTVAALVTPFLILALTGEPLSQTIFWALDYFVFAFFSVYRTLLFSDLSLKYTLPFIAGFGLLFGRLGDVAGTLINYFLNGRTTWLVTLASLLFVLTLIPFFRLYQTMYMHVPRQKDRPGEQEIFDHFSSRYDLSAREQDVLHLLLDKKTNPEIAETLFISDRTVKFHIHNLLAKTGSKNRTELLSKYRAETSG